MSNIYAKIVDSMQKVFPAEEPCGEERADQDQKASDEDAEVRDIEDDVSKRLQSEFQIIHHIAARQVVAYIAGSAADHQRAAQLQWASGRA